LTKYPSFRDSIVACYSLYKDHGRMYSIDEVKTMISYKKTFALLKEKKVSHGRFIK